MVECTDVHQYKTPARHLHTTHPHWCGADSLNSRTIETFYCNESPHMRGGLVARGNNHSSHRLIPAGAGRTTTGALAVRAMKPHPRRCGADSIKRTPAITRSASSPPVRGGRRLGDVSRDMARLIPACAGRTLTGQYERLRSIRLLNVSERCAISLIVSLTDTRNATKSVTLKATTPEYI